MEEEDSGVQKSHIVVKVEKVEAAAARCMVAVRFSGPSYGELELSLDHTEGYIRYFARLVNRQLAARSSVVPKCRQGDGIIFAHLPVGVEFGVVKAPKQRLKHGGKYV